MSDFPSAYAPVNSITTGGTAQPMSEVVKKLEEARDNKRYLTVDDLNEAIAALTVDGKPDGWVVKLRGTFLRYEMSLPDPFPDADFTAYPVYRAPVVVDDAMFARFLDAD